MREGQCRPGEVLQLEIPGDVVAGRVRCSHEAKVSFIKPLESFEQRNNIVYDLKGLL